MEELNEIKINDVIYVRKDNIEKPKKIELFDEIQYAGFTWNVIAGDNESLTLLMKNVLKINGNVKLMEFNKDNKLWWKDSSVQKFLNNEFIKKINPDKLLLMATEVWNNNTFSLTYDKVRLLSVEEIFRLPKSILDKDYWYWSLSPYSMYTGDRAYVFIVYNGGYLGYTGVNYTGAVAPVIRIKRSALNEQ